MRHKQCIYKVKVNSSVNGECIICLLFISWLVVFCFFILKYKYENIVLTLAIHWLSLCCPIMHVHMCFRYEVKELDSIPKHKNKTIWHVWAWKQDCLQWSLKKNIFDSDGSDLYNSYMCIFYCFLWGEEKINFYLWDLNGVFIKILIVCFLCFAPLLFKCVLTINHAVPCYRAELMFQSRQLPFWRRVHWFSHTCAWKLKVDYQFLSPKIN